MANEVKPIPDGYHTVTPAIVVRNGAKAIDFYEQAFGARVGTRMDGPDGKIMHAELTIGDSKIMLSDEYCDYGTFSPETVGGTPVTIFLYVEDVDAVFKAAVDAGATSKMEPADQFWGDRYGKLVDPFGHSWSLATHIKDMTDEETREAAEEAMAQMPSPAAAEA